MDNKSIARILRETAELLQIDGAIIGRYRSYEKAAELIGGMHESIEQMAKEPGKLEELPGIGERMAEHIEEIIATGDYGLRKKLLKKFPATLLEIMTLQSLGPKKVAFLWSNFQAATVADVEKLAKEGKLRDVPGFGEKTEQNILKAVETFKRSTGRFRIDKAEAAAADLIEFIKQYGKGVESITPAGSLRRGRETVGDLDLLLILSEGHTSQKKVDAIAEHILKFPRIEQTLAHGENKVSFTLQNGLQVDVRLLEKESFGAALLYFSGSKEHNVALRGRANDMGLTLNEYALATLKGEKPVARRTEEEIYAKLKLDYIPPELRENKGEIAAAEAHKLPQLLEVTDMTGDPHMHTTASDGKNSIEEMAEAARKLGHKFIALTDHSKAVTVANGLDEKRMTEHLQKIREANEKGLGIRLFAGSEVDILKDGSLDYSDELLAQMDVVVCSVHSYFNLDRSEMTDTHARGNRKSVCADHWTSYGAADLATRSARLRYGENSGCLCKARRGHGVQFFPRQAGFERHPLADVQGARRESRHFDGLAYHVESALHSTWRYCSAGGVGLKRKTYSILYRRSSSWRRCAPNLARQSEPPH